MAAADPSRTTAPPNLEECSMARISLRYVVSTLLLVLPSLALAHADPTMADYWERQKRYALERMDATARDKSRCRSIYRTARGIFACESSADEWRFYWNERYMEATREYEKAR
jgi:hypothetical protein